MNVHKTRSQKPLLWLTATSCIPLNCWKPRSKCGVKINFPAYFGATFLQRAQGDWYGLMLCLYCLSSSAKAAQWRYNSNRVHIPFHYWHWNAIWQDSKRMFCDRTVNSTTTVRTETTSGYRLYRPQRLDLNHYSIWICRASCTFGFFDC